jgi:hypothetical protein
MIRPQTLRIEDRACAAALIVHGCRLVRALYSDTPGQWDVFEFSDADGSATEAFNLWKRSEIVGPMRRYSAVLRDLAKRRIG